MVRIARYAKLKHGCESEYIKRHKEVWPEILKLIKGAGVKNYSIYIRGLDLFSYLEVDDWNRTIGKMLGDPAGDKFQEYMASLMDSSTLESP